MLDRVKQIPARLLEIWKKYSKKQKRIIISAVSVILLTLVIMILILGRTQYVPLAEFEDVKSSMQAVDLLKSAGIKYQVSSDNTAISVDVKKKTDAIGLIYTSDIASDDDFDRNALLKNDMSTTNYDKKLKQNLYNQDVLANLVKSFEGVNSAEINYAFKENVSILDKNKDTSCSIFINTNNQFKAYAAENIAYAIAAALGNSDTKSIVIVDQRGNLLYNGSEEESNSNISQADKRLRFEKENIDMYQERIIALAVANGFADAYAGVNLEFIYDEENVVFKEYLAAEGQEQGLYDFYKRTTTESTSANGDPPGTDSNDETDYYIQNTNSGSSASETLEIDYAPSERLTETMKATNVINKEDSSIFITLTRNIVRTQEQLETLGLLDGTTYDRYVADYLEPVSITVSDELRQGFADATGIPVENISVVAKEVYTFFAKQPSETNWDLILKIILAALILGMLIFVVFRGMKPVEVTELEPELSVEQLLATTKENQSLEDIEFSEKSETRRMIEKFVDENPQAVANLLRSWLEDSWE